MKRLLNRVAASIADQGVASGTNFVLNIVLARWLLPREYGAYSVCWSVLLVLAGFHNALILEPMTVVGPAEFRNELPGYFAGVNRLNWLVISLLSAASLAFAALYRQPTVRSSLFVLAACAPGYLLLLVARRKQYVLNTPLRALRLSLTYALLVFAVIGVARFSGHLCVNTALLSFGAAGLAGLSIRSGARTQSLQTSQIAREHWRYGKWLFASAILAMGAPDVQTILLSMLVDLKSAGALRALMNFVLPVSQLITILSIYVLPRLAGRAKEWGAHRLLKEGLRFPAALSAVLAVYLGLLILFAPQLEQLLYGGRMREYLQWVPLLAASAFAAGVGSSFSTLLRAVQNSQHQFIAGVAGSAVGIGCAFALLRRMGIAGAFWSLLAANLASTLIIVGSYVWVLRRRRA